MSIIKHPNQRVGVFIDAQNLYHSGKNLYGRRVNFKNIMDVAISGRSLIRALAYVITTESGEETPFFDALTKLGVETKAKDLQIFSGGAKKADWDVGIAIDAVTLAPKLDTVVLVTGDGDFVPLVEYLKKHSGCQVEAISFSRSSSSKLIEAVDDFHDMCDNPNDFLISSKWQGNNNGSRNRKINKPNSDFLNFKEEKIADKNRDHKEEKVVIQRAITEKVTDTENKKTPVAKDEVKKTRKPIRKKPENINKKGETKSSVRAPRKKPSQVKANKKVKK